MKILLTNDDGIYSNGLYALFEAFGKEHDITVVAPDTEQSAVGHAITLTDPIRVKKVKKNKGFLGYAVTGTPADCVKIAYHEILKTMPDLLVSGINYGANVGLNIIYSGTVSAATEGTILGIPSIAVSVNHLTDPNFSAAVQFMLKFIHIVNEQGMPQGTSLNVNAPSIDYKNIKGVCLTRQGMARFQEKFDKRTDPRGGIYYWQSGETVLNTDPEDTDAYAIAHDYISITPLRHDLTSYKILKKMKDWDLSAILK